MGPHFSGSHLDLTDVNTDQHNAAYTNADAVDAVGPHFSGSHLGLTDVDTDQHHAAYTDVQAIADVGPHFSKDHADLTNVTPSQHHESQASQVDQLQDLLVHFSREYDEVFIRGANLHVVNGTGSTETANALGNVIIGYNEERITGNDRSGSHMLVVGTELNYTQYGGVVVGDMNTTSGPFSSVSGGFANTASGTHSSVSGGVSSTASGQRSSVSGGAANTASGARSSASGGNGNTASGTVSHPNTHP